jgi:hypothetical protein
MMEEIATFIAFVIGILFLIQNDNSTGKDKIILKAINSVGYILVFLAFAMFYTLS